MSGLQITEVSVSYGRREVVRGVTLPELQAGTLTALIGPNGTGKSTLLRALAGLESMKGTLHLQGQDMTRASLAARARAITYMPQQLPPGLSLSVMESVLAALRVAPPEGELMELAWQALQRIGIGHLADRLLSDLSGGQRQLVSLAQLLARRPQVLLLDEPTSALDLNYQLRVMQCLQQQVREHGLIAVVVLHDINLAARFADQLAVLHQGHLHAFGSAQQVLEPALFAEVYSVHSRVERCSAGTLQVLVDRAIVEV